MSTLTQFDPDTYGEYERAFNVEMLQTQVFGAIFAAWEYRKSDVGMTNVEIARRTGHTRSQISKLMCAPQNWTLKTIAELTTALDVDFRFVLVDRTSTNRCFDAGGVSYAVLMGVDQAWTNVRRQGLDAGMMNGQSIRGGQIRQSGSRGLHATVEALTSDKAWAVPESKAGLAQTSEKLTSA